MTEEQFATNHPVVYTLFGVIGLAVSFLSFYGLVVML